MFEDQLCDTPLFALVAVYKYDDAHANVVWFKLNIWVQKLKVIQAEEANHAEDCE